MIPLLTFLNIQKQGPQATLGSETPRTTRGESQRKALLSRGGERLPNELISPETSPRQRPTSQRQNSRHQGIAPWSEDSEDKAPDGRATEQRHAVGAEADPGGRS